MSDVESLQAEIKRLQSELQGLDVGGEKITVADYLLTRLEQLGVKVPFTHTFYMFYLIEFI